MVFTEMFHEAQRKRTKPLCSQPSADRNSQGGKRKTRSRKKRKLKSEEKSTEPSVPSPFSNASGGGVAASFSRSGRSQKSRPEKNRRLQSVSAPSAEAIALSASLKDLSARKRIKEALELYWDKSNDLLRDGHHGSIVIDCCARCGAVEEGEKIVSSMERAGNRVSVQASTALLKGYAHSGMIGKGEALYQSMLQSKDKRDRPNVRTFNTILRGCLWTAASISKLEGSDGRCTVTGGVATSETLWSLSSGVAKQTRARGHQGVLFDSSSYEYSVTLLCQALRCEEALGRIAEMQRVYGVQSTTEGNEKGDRFSGVDQAILESLAVSLLSLARAYALLGRNEHARKNALSALNAAVATSSLAATFQSNDGNVEAQSKNFVRGGKRAWRQVNWDNHPTHGGAASRRSSSNSLFRNHHLSEIKIEAESILKSCSGNSPLEKSGLLAFFLVTRLLYFSGGGTTVLPATQQHSDVSSTKENSKATRDRLLLALWLSFGLPAAIGRVSFDPCMASSNDVPTALSRRERLLINEATGNSSEAVIADDGFIHFPNVFVPYKERRCQQKGEDSKPSSSVNDKQKRPLHIELGAGSGDWIVSQARLNPSNDYVAVELRADRVAQTFSKFMLNAAGTHTFPPLENVCCVGSECGAFLRDRVRNGSVSMIYVNHPEPPTQTYGSDTKDIAAVVCGDDDEPAHMLNSENLLSASLCLEVEGSGRLVIVTDNRWYARLLCVTLQKVMSKNEGLLRQTNLNESGGIRRVETFGGTSGGAARNQCTSEVVLYEGQPSEAIGHSVPKRASSGGRAGRSYFDRLWRTGAGSHAEVKKRFIIAVQTVGRNDARCTKSSHMRFSHDGEKDTYLVDGGLETATTALSGLGPKKDKVKRKANKKKSSAKQQRRNKRRLLAKKQADAKANALSPG